MTDHPRIDWFVVLRDLQRCGYSVHRVSQDLDIVRARLIRAQEGRYDMRHAEGERVIGLWCRVTKRVAEQLPIAECRVVG